MESALHIKTKILPGHKVEFVIPQGDVGEDIEVIVVLSGASSSDQTNQHPYDFSDIAGSLDWKGDAVMVQRSLRDEW